MGNGWWTLGLNNKLSLEWALPLSNCIHTFEANLPSLLEVFSDLMAGCFVGELSSWDRKVEQLKLDDRSVVILVVVAVASH